MPDEYVFWVDYRYDTRTSQNDINVISKQLKADTDDAFSYEQVSSRRGIAHRYYKTLGEALQNSILAPNECEFVGITDEELKEELKRRQYAEKRN